MFKLYLIRPKFYRSTSNIMCSNVTLSCQLRPNIISLYLAWIYMYITPLSLNITPVSLYNKWIVCLSSAVQEMATSWITAGWVQNRGLTSKHFSTTSDHIFKPCHSGQTSDWLQRELCFLYKESNSLLISSIQTQPLYKPSKLGSYATSQPSSVIGPRLLFNQSLFLFTHMSRTATLNHTFLSPPLTSCSRLCLLLVPCNLKFPTGSLHPTNQARMNPKTQNYFNFQPLPRNSAQAKSKYPSTQQKQTPSHAASIHTSSNNSGKKMKKNKKNEKKDQPERKKKAKKWKATGTTQDIFPSAKSENNHIPWTRKNCWEKCRTFSGKSNVFPPIKSTWRDQRNHWQCPHNRKPRKGRYVSSETILLTIWLLLSLFVQTCPFHALRFSSFLKDSPPSGIATKRFSACGIIGIVYGLS